MGFWTRTAFAQPIASGLAPCFRVLSELAYIQFSGIVSGADLDAHWRLIWVWYNGSNPGSGSQQMAGNASLAAIVQPIVKWGLMFVGMRNVVRILFVPRA